MAIIIQLPVRWCDNTEIMSLCTQMCYKTG